MDERSYNGLLVIDKPGGITSRTVVDRAQTWFPRGTRLGHTGTLDPLATGVLVLCVGIATRLTEYVQRMDKVYLAGIRLGVRSTTDDADGDVTPMTGVEPPSAKFVTECLRNFLGEIEQIPPAFSAAKVGGQRAYALARRGKEVELASRQVRIYDIQILRFGYPDLEIEVRCGKGTYIRSLARDLGDRLGCGAMIASLRRTRVGPFRADNALSLETEAAVARQNLLAMDLAVSDLPRVTLKPEEEIRWRQGQEIPRVLEGEIGEGREVAVFTESQGLAGIGVYQGKCLRPEKVIPL